MPYKLLAVDMDGTLLNSASELTERTKIAIRAAINRGILFVPATGRPMLGMGFLNELLDDDLPFIVYNGARVVTGKTEKVLFSKSLDFRFAKDIYALGVSRNIPVVIWRDERLFVSRDCAEIQKYRGISDAKMEIIGDIAMLSDQAVTKMIWILPQEQAGAYQDEMNAYFNGHVNCHTSRPYLLEFVDTEASKGRALEEIGKIYGIDAKEMIAVGDSYNDLSMLEYAGLGVAMGNAPDDIQAVCQYVAPSNDEDGVAEVVEKFIVYSD
ncbi:MAG: Cof-type HAD-IIB family hydrolase [Oscillospiraceae bacterium]|nr:Cof-type HAD-IIB family hydrolase [Oscillospiraceae bacterium]